MFRSMSLRFKALSLKRIFMVVACAWFVFSVFWVVCVPYVFIWTDVWSWEPDGWAELLLDLILMMVTAPLVIFMYANAPVGVPLQTALDGDASTARGLAVLMSMLTLDSVIVASFVTAVTALLRYQHTHADASGEAQ